MSRLSLPSFVAGATLSLGLMTIPAYSLATADPAADPADDQPAFDGTAPSLVVDPINFAVGQSIDNTNPPNDCGSGAWHFNIPLELAWSARDTGSGVESFDVIDATNQEGGTLRRIEATSTTEWSIAGLNYRNVCGAGGGYNVSNYHVLARDTVGNVAISRGSAAPFVHVWQEDGSYAPTDGTLDDLQAQTIGNWRQGRCLCFDANKTLYSTKGGNSLKYEVEGRVGETVAVVMEKNNNRGEVGIRLNNGPATIVDTYATTAKHRVIVWEAKLNEGLNTVKVTNRGIPGRLRVDVDALMKTSHPRGELDLEIRNLGERNSNGVAGQ